jgi:DNA-directed RNA polymerase specialized sigma24 family protein
VRVVEGDPLLAGAPDAIPVAEVPEEPFGLAGTTVAAMVDAPASAAAVLQLLVRGADVVLRLDLPDAAGFSDAVGRIADVRAVDAPALDREQRALLDLLSRGFTASQAARKVGMSLRTAHRRLHAARSAVGAACNIEVLGRLGDPR